MWNADRGIRNSGVTFKMADDEQVEETAADVLFPISWWRPGHWLRGKAPSVRMKLSQQAYCRFIEITNFLRQKYAMENGSGPFGHLVAIATHIQPGVISVIVSPHPDGNTTQS